MEAVSPQPGASRIDATIDDSITVEQASALFSDAGVPRSPRTVMRYCAHGHLDCRKIDTERNEKYLVSQESLDRRINELLQVNASTARHDTSERDTTRRDSTQRDTSRNDEDNQGLEGRVKELEAENLDLKITNRAKDQFIEMARQNRESLLEKLTSATRTIGQLETRIRLALGSGAQKNAATDDTRLDEELGYPHDATSDSASPVVPMSSSSPFSCLARKPCDDGAVARGSAALRRPR